MYNNCFIFLSDWVIRLGPEVNQLYDYSIVTSSTEETKRLYVLLRDPQQLGRYQSEILAFLEQKGFDDFWTEPERIPHPEDCLYPEYP